MAMRRSVGMLLGAAALAVAAMAAEAAQPRAPAGQTRAAAPGAARPAAVKKVRGTGSYAVVVSADTYADRAWLGVVQALQKKHNAWVIVYAGGVADTRAALAEVAPRYACFVARPEEAGGAFVMAVHRLTRALDDDPYTDCLWGILTGYEAADALRIAEMKEPLVVRRGAAGTGINLGLFDEGVWYDEGAKGVYWEKKPGGTPEKKTCPDDTTQALADVFNTFKPDLFMTSGHATTRDWQIGYNYKNGQFRCEGGQLYGLDLAGKRWPIQSPNPKVYLPLGNCLMGLIPDRDAMALEFMRSGGVRQMVGYTVPTWYGFGGWGIGDYFMDQAGRFTLAEAFFANEQALVWT
ncbi:MAG: hypothetical protein IMZ66_08860, partial [Planctomycetes bacterium]|nr:hypothetical protein [Planctomycetota bacterium]